MRVLVLGAGRMGTAAAKDLIDSEVEVAVGERRRESLSLCRGKVKSPKLETFKVDASNRDSLIKLLRKGDFDVVVNALPHEISLLALKAEIDAGVNVVDMVFEDEQMELRDKVTGKGVTVIPACGVAPGLGNMLAGYGASKIDSVDTVRMLCGGLPQKPTPPLDYKVVFRLESVWAMYARGARIVVNGEIREVNALTGLELVEFPGVGKFEGFYTDGLSTLLYTFKENEKFRNVKEMFEKTLRYPGHVEKIKTLMECGLLDVEPVHVRKGRISPREFLTVLLTPKLELGDERDMLVMRVEVLGDNECKRYTFDLVDYYDKVGEVTSMARTTGYTASIVAQLIGQGKIEEKGIIPPEELGMRDTFRLILDQLSKRGIKIKGYYSETFSSLLPADPTA